MEANPVSGNSIEARAILRKEISILLVAQGTIFALLAYLAFIGLRDNPHPLWGTPRYVALGLPLSLLAGTHLLAGILLACTRSGVFAILGALASTVVAIVYVAFMVSATGTLPMTVITVVAIAIPVVVWQRTVVFLAVGTS